MNTRGRLALVGAMFSAVACGGGGDDGGADTARCSDFRYQQDAQDYFRSHNASQLDGDRDGIACEDLPNRPASSPPPPPTAGTAQGLWVGTTNTARTATTVVLDSGQYWVIYSAPNNSALIAGAIQGQSTSSNGTFSSTSARDFNLEGLGINDATISGSYVSRQSLAGTVTYQSQSVTFNGAYSVLYDQAPSLSSIAGTYSGTAAVLAGTESATVTIAANGALSGLGASGCQFTGSAAPRAAGNVYNVSVTFGGGVCSNGTSTVTGIGILDATGKRLYGTALNSGRTNGFIFVGTKP